MSNVKVGATKNRGDYIETVVHDTTRVGDPITAKIYQQGGMFLIVPESDMYPVVRRDSLTEAVGFVEQLIPDEKGSFFV